ncbi:ferric uptake regulation protein [Candidatus Rickettsiella viridis]|uniref:Ferric uptake regulation protein n=1 Tax=Candidatus Rickettsiella viridis TaxID=676208 RepID=A0A2Z5UTF3_9COXI|nr:ferric iron uptake transcriptional regulator [Candidatus Rickettsiella viridis]BBB14714.1 ferric uptake regulation protein [Candidatus Rickettsiella viridis]
MDNQQLRQAGLKITAPRLKILALLEQASTRHLSAEDIYKALLESGEDIGLATVYRVLTQFETAGLVKQQNFEEGYSVFELNQGAHHDHLVCIKCGKVDEFVDKIIEQRQEAVAKQRGYKMTDHSLIIYGICSRCTKRVINK